MNDIDKGSAKKHRRFKPNIYDYIYYYIYVCWRPFEKIASELTRDYVAHIFVIFQIAMLESINVASLLFILYDKINTVETYNDTISNILNFIPFAFFSIFNLIYFAKKRRQKIVAYCDKHNKFPLALNYILLIVLYIASFKMLYIYDAIPRNVPPEFIRLHFVQDNRIYYYGSRHQALSDYLESGEHTRNLSLYLTNRQPMQYIPEMITNHRGGYYYELDGGYGRGSQRVLLKSILGFWRIGRDGRLVGHFVVNPAYERYGHPRPKGSSELWSDFYKIKRRDIYVNLE